MLFYRSARRRHLGPRGGNRWLDCLGKRDIRSRMIMELVVAIESGAGLAAGLHECRVDIDEAAAGSCSAKLSNQRVRFINDSHAIFFLRRAGDRCIYKT